MNTAAIENIEKKRKAVDEIEGLLNAVEEARPGDWITTLGSGHNQCTSITAELITGRRDEDGKEVEKPCDCRYRADPTRYKDPSAVQCKRHPELRWVKLCNDPERFPEDCPLEPDNVYAMFVCDCLPDYLLDEEPAIPDHVPILKFLENIKPYLRFLIDEARAGLAREQISIDLFVGLRKASKGEREALVITPAISKIVGLEAPRVIEFPTLDEVERAVEDVDAVRLLTWYRFLPSALTEDARKIQDRIYVVVSEGFKRARAKPEEPEKDDKVEALRTATADLVEMIEAEELMPASLSYFAEVKNALGAFDE